MSDFCDNAGIQTVIHLHPYNPLHSLALLYYWVFSVPIGLKQGLSTASLMYFHKNKSQLY